MSDTYTLREIKVMPLPRPEKASEMSLRDYFAGQVLPTIIAQHKDRLWSTGMIAETAYEVADAMLQERKK